MVKAKHEESDQDDLIGYWRVLWKDKQLVAQRQRCSTLVTSEVFTELLRTRSSRPVRREERWRLDLKPADDRPSYKPVKADKIPATVYVTTEGGEKEEWMVEYKFVTYTFNPEQMKHTISLEDIHDDDVDAWVLRHYQAAKEAGTLTKEANGSSSFPVKSADDCHYATVTSFSFGHGDLEGTEPWVDKDGNQHIGPWIQNVDLNISIEDKYVQGPEDSDDSLLGKRIFFRIEQKGHGEESNSSEAEEDEEEERDEEDEDDEEDEEEASSAVTSAESDSD